MSAFVAEVDSYPVDSVVHFGRVGTINICKRKLMA